MTPPQRPSLLDLRSKSSASNLSSASKPMRSPRLHVAGEVPPELSPLDAFAMQSRLLARQLQDAADDAGKRMSRLPPLTVESPLIQQGRSEYFRSMSQDDCSEGSPTPEPYNTGLGLMTEIDEGTERPMSMHPRMSRIPPTPDDGIPLPPQPINDMLPARGRQLRQIDEDGTSFGARREESPSPIESAPGDDRSFYSSSPRKGGSLPRPRSQPSNQLGASPEKPAKKHSFEAAGLAPPRPNFTKRSSSTKIGRASCRERVL